MLADVIKVREVLMISGHMLMRSAGAQPAAGVRYRLPGVCDVAWLRHNSHLGAGLCDGRPRRGCLCRAPFLQAWLLHAHLPVILQELWPLWCHIESYHSPLLIAFRRACWKPDLCGQEQSVSSCCAEPVARCCAHPVVQPSLPWRPHRVHSHQQPGALRRVVFRGVVRSADR